MLLCTSKPNFEIMLPGARIIDLLILNNYIEKNKQFDLIYSSMILFTSKCFFVQLFRLKIQSLGTLKKLHQVGFTLT